MKTWTPHTRGAIREYRHHLNWLNHDWEVWFDYSPAERQTRNYPGAPEEITINRLFLQIDTPHSSEPVSVPMSYEFIDHAQVELAELLFDYKNQEEPGERDY